MADIRIKDLPTTATQTASDDFIALDGTVNGTRKIDASAPSFKTSVTSPSIVAPAATALTLTGGSSGASLVLGAVANGSAYYTSKGAGYHIFTTAALKATAATNTLATWSSADAIPSTLVAEFTGSATGSARTVSLFGYDAAVGGLSMILQRAGGNLLIGTTTDMTGSGGLKIAGTTAATTTTSGALIVAGGVGVSGNIYAGSTILANGNATATNGVTTTGTLAQLYFAADTSGANVYGALLATNTEAQLKTNSNHALKLGTNNTTRVTIAAGGNVDVAATTPASSSTVGALTIGNGTAATNVAIGAGQVAIGGGNLSANAQSALTIAPTITPISGNIYGLKMDISTLSGASVGTVNPVAVSSTNTGTTNAADQTVFQSTINQSATSGNITNVINYRAANALLNASNVSNLYGYRFADTFASSTGVVANQYAFYADAMTRGTVNNYAFYSAGAGKVYLGDTTASTGSTSGALQVAGGIYAGAASVFGGVTTFTSAAGSAYPLVSTTAADSIAYIAFTPQTGTGRSFSVGVGGPGATVDSGVLANKWFIRNNSTSTRPLIIDGTTDAATFAGIIKPQQATTAGAPAYVKGAIYFDTTLNKLRVGGATAWETITSV